MPTAVLGANLIDELVPIVDEIRTDLHSIFGDRQHRVFIVKRSWSGETPGEGTPTILSSVEIVPQPKVMMRGLNGELRACGLEEEGNIVLTEVSLTWAEPELYLTAHAENEEIYYRVTDGQGQAIRSRYYVASDPPMTDRSGEDDPNNAVGWVVDLRRVEVQE